MNLASQLAKLRGNMSQAALAEKSGVPQSAISEIEAGKRIPRANTLFALAEALGVDVNELYGRKKAAGE